MLVLHIVEIRCVVYLGLGVYLFMYIKNLKSCLLHLAKSFFDYSVFLFFNKPREKSTSTNHQPRSICLTIKQKTNSPKTIFERFFNIHGNICKHLIYEI